MLIFDFLISFLSPFFIKIQGFFPYRDLINSYHLPQFLTTFANFDGAHYISIATHGYAQYEQAFFPLYPLLIKFISPVFQNNHLLTGLIISNLSFLIGLFVLKKYLDSLCHPELGSGSRSRNKFGMTQWTILFLLSFPTSFFFGSVYTEGLFFLFVVLTFYFLKKEKYFYAGLFAMFASLTRLVGVFLIIPIIIQVIYKFKYQNSNKQNSSRLRSNNNRYASSERSESRSLKPLILKIIAILFPILGLGIYSFYLFYTTRDPLLFFHAQSSFNLNRSTELILLPQVYFRYFKIFLTAAHNWQYFIALFEFITFSFVSGVLLLDLRKIILHVIARERSDRGNPSKVGRKLTGLLRFARNDSNINYNRLGLNLFSFANLLLPTFTGTLLSIPRFSLLSLSFFIYLAEIKNKWIKISITAIFIIFHIIILSFFIRGYFVS